jgi:hypothetical protein
MTITLTPDIEKALAIEATRKGTTPEELALGCLRSSFVRQQPGTAPTQAKNLAEYLGLYIGAVSSSGSSAMSVDTGKKFTEILLKKREQGKL